MKYFLLTIIFSSSTLFAQQKSNPVLDSLEKVLLKTENKFKNFERNVKKEVNDLNSKMNEEKIENKNQSELLEALVFKKDSLLQEKVTELYNNLEANNDKLNEEQAKAEKNFLYTIVGILVVLVLLIVIYLMTQRRANSIEQKTGDLDASAAEIKKQLSDLSASTSEDLASALEKFASVSSNQVPETEPDHTMVKEFAKQIVSMENNMSRMDANDRGLKRIKRALDNMHDTLKTMDYEITPLLGKNVIEGQIIEIDRQEADESVTPGQRIIYNVLKAEILFKGEQIQSAKVDIKYNPND